MVAGATFVMYVLRYRSPQLYQEYQLPFLVPQRPHAYLLALMCTDASCCAFLVLLLSVKYVQGFCADAQREVHAIGQVQSVIELNSTLLVYEPHVPHEHQGGYYGKRYRVRVYHQRSARSQQTEDSSSDRTQQKKSVTVLLVYQCQSSRCKSRVLVEFCKYLNP